MARGRVVSFAVAVTGSIVLVIAGAIIAARLALLHRIASLDDAVPVDVVEVTRPIGELRGDAERCAGLCRDFLARWPGSGRAWEVRGTWIRMLRFLEKHPAQGARNPGAGEAQEEKDSRAREEIDLARLVVGRRELPPAQRHAALEVLLERDPANLGRLREFAGLIEELQGAYSRDASSAPAGPGRSQLESRRSSLQHLLQQVYLALGDRESFDRLCPGGTSFLRSLFDKYSGRPLDTAALADIGWLTEAHLDLKASRGKPVVLMTVGAGTGGDRLRALQDLLDGRRSQGVAGAVFAADPGDARTDRTAQSLRAGLESRKIALPAGLIPLERLKKVFPRSCSGACVVLDEDGKYAWETILIPPPSPEWSLTQLVLDRLLAN